MTEGKDRPKKPSERRQPGEDRRKASDRRGGADRRAGYDRRAGKDRRESSPGRRKADFDISDRRPPERKINEYTLNAEELEFINAVDHYKKTYGKPFPTWSEILHILKSIGYEKSE
jgi:hypothetical protein